MKPQAGRRLLGADRAGRALAAVDADLTSKRTDQPEIHTLHLINGARPSPCVVSTRQPQTSPEGEPATHDAIGPAQPIDDPVGFRLPANVRRRYERVRRCPEGLLVFGDAGSSFNPIYGQGMTVAALQALALRDHLRPGVTPSSRRVLRAFARVIDVPWELALGADLSLPGVDGPRPAKRRFANGYVSRLQAAAAGDPELSRAFVRVTGLIDRPEALLRPATALRVRVRARRRERERNRAGRSGTVPR